MVSTLPAGYAPTYDADGVGTPHTATVTLEADETNLAVDFGYRPAASPGTGTLGYWKNHEEAWPVDAITIGGVPYTKAQAIVLLKKPTSVDKTYALANQLIVAKLNMASGNSSYCISSVVTGPICLNAILPSRPMITVSGTMLTA